MDTLPTYEEVMTNPHKYPIIKGKAKVNLPPKRK